ncbi:transcriptional activator Myb-like [Pantherophis guttatus]|uniref:Transcriptional activator Myb-like n=1 Tax=Pantherophis guttatus TaxID=94885 RepID=A0ABM3ZNQ9_PANGU|nr:transcriptional activator Myb-like [Pantherophis guttatus]
MALAILIMRHYNDEDPEKEKRIKELELLLMSTENELKGQQALPTQNHTSDYPGWHSTTIADNTRTSGNGAAISSLGEHHCTASPPMDHGCLPEESASPARCMIVHQSNFLDNVKNLLEFAETLQLIDSDLSSWGDLSSFEFSETSNASPTQVPSDRTPQLQKTDSSVCRPEGHPLADLSKAMLSQDSFALPKSLTGSKCGPAPLVILRAKRSHSMNHLANGHNKSFILAEVSSSTPKHSPVKSLPFSPSQFFSTSSIQESLDLDNPILSSTPLCNHKVGTTPLQKDQGFKSQKENNSFRTPAIKRSILESSPRTPTPFKNAIAAQELKYGPLKMLPQTPTHLVDDLQDVIKQESDESGIVSSLCENGSPLLKKIKQEVDSPAGKAENFLCSNSWEGEGLNAQLFPYASSAEDVPNLLTSSHLKMPTPEEEDNNHKLFTFHRSRSSSSPLQA